MLKKMYCLSNAMVLCTIAIFCLLEVAPCYAQVPRQISYQGIVTNESGGPISDGEHTIIVSLYFGSVGGAPIFSEIHTARTSHGLFSISIGSDTPIPSSIPFDKAMYLGIAIDGENELTPRTALLAVPYAIHSEVADLAKGFTSDAKGIITSINEVSGSVRIIGDSTISVKQNGNSISLHSLITPTNTDGIKDIEAADNSIRVINKKGPMTGLQVNSNGITTDKLADASVTPAKLDDAGASIGQVLKWNGVTWVPSNDSSTVYMPGTGISIASNIISVKQPLPVGTTPDATLRWDGKNWKENVNFTSDDLGQTKINNSLSLLNAGSASELKFYEEASNGAHYSSFKAGKQNSDINYTLPPSLPSQEAYLSVSATGELLWTPPVAPPPITFDQIHSGVNSGEILTVGQGSTLVPSSTGVIAANQFIGVSSVSNAVDLSTDEVGGILPIARGGTNSSTPLSNNRLMYSSSGSIAELAAGTAGQVLTSGGTASPSWRTIEETPSGSTNNSTLRWDAASSQWQENTNVLTSSAGELTVNNGIGLNGSASSLKINGSAGTPGQILMSAGSGNTPTWMTFSPIEDGTMINSTLYWDGMSWVENPSVLETANGEVIVIGGVSYNGPSSPIKLNNNSGSIGQVLTSAGQNATPTWSTINLLPNGTTTDGTLRWNGSQWVENINVRSSANGEVLVNGGVNYNGASSPIKLNGSTGSLGQVLRSMGSGSTPIWTTIDELPTGSSINSTLRWDGTSWVENPMVTETAAGQVTALGGINLGGISSPFELNGVSGSNGQVLVSNGAGNTPSWNTINLLPTATTMNSTLRWNGTNWVENSNVRSTATGQVIVTGGQNFSGAASPLELNGSTGSVGQVLTSGGTGSTPTWSSITLLPTGSATDNTLRWNGTNWVESANIKSSAAGQLTANAGVNLNGGTSPFQLNGSAGMNGQVLTSVGAGSTPVWTSLNTLPNGSITDGTLRWDGSVWVENTNVRSSSIGEITVQAGVNYNGASSPVKLNGSAGTTGQILTSAGANNTPTWNTVNLLPTASTTDATLRWNGTQWVENQNVLSSSMGKVTANAGVSLNGAASPFELNGSVGSIGQVLTSSGTGATPTWTTLASLPTGSATDNTLRWNGTTWVETSNIKSSVAGQLTANAGVNLNGTTSPLQLNGAAGTTGQVLVSAGTNATPSWMSIATLPTASSTDNTLRWNGTSWVETSTIKSSAAGQLTANAGINLNGTTSPLQLNGTTGTSGQVLVSAGANTTPSWMSIATLPTASATDNTLRWNGTNWVETSNIKSSAAGQVTANAGINLNGNSSPVQLNGSTGTSGQVLTSAGAGVTPTWTTVTTIPAASATDNTLRWNGTNWVESASIKSSAAGQLTANAGINLNGNASPVQMNGSAGTSGQVLTSGGAGATPTWTTVTTIPGASATDNTLRWNGSNWVETANIKSSAAGQLTANAGINLNGTTSPVQLNGSTGTSGQVLTSAGAGSTPTWTSITSLPTASATDNTLRWNGTNWVETANIKSSVAGQLTVASGVSFSGASSPILLNGSTGNSGQILVSGGASATPTWATANLLGNGTATNSTLRWTGSNWVENTTILSSASGQLTVSAGLKLNGAANPIDLNGSTGNSGQVLTSNGVGATPSWTTISTLPTASATDNTLRWNGTAWVENGNVKSSAVGQVTVASGVNFTGNTSSLQLDGVSGSMGQVLTSSGPNATPTWTTMIPITPGSSSDNTLRWSGTTWVESGSVKSTSGGELSAIGGVTLSGTASPLKLNNSVGTAGQVLVSAGAGATPIWSTIPTMPTASAPDNTLRWNGTNWVETANVKSSSAGLLTVAAGITVSGTNSPLNIRGTDGTANYILTSQGSGNSPQWTDPNTLITAWKPIGNSIAGTDGTNNVIGSVAGSTLTPVNIIVNGNRAMRFESSATSPNVIGGFNSNAATSSAIGATIAGGGFAANANTVSDNYGAIGGGAGNTAGNSGGGSTYATVSGGLTNTASGQYSSVSGGRINTAQGTASKVGGGENNIARGNYSNISGGQGNTITTGSTYSAIAGGKDLTLGATSFGVNMGSASDVSAISNVSYFGNMNMMLGNTDNTARQLQFFEPNSSATYSGTNYTAFIAGAQTNNIIYTLPSTEPSANQILSATAVSGSGPYNVTLGWAAPGAASGWALTGNTGTTPGTNFVGTTDNKQLYLQVKNGATINNSFILNNNFSLQRDAAGNARGSNAVDLQSNRGSVTQVANGMSSTISGGALNTASGHYSTVAGGYGNTASSVYSVVSGGQGNSITSPQLGIIVGGSNNVVTGQAATIVGGIADTAAGSNSFVGGGDANYAGGDGSVIGGGTMNNIPLAKNYSVIPGGQALTLGGYSFGVNMGNPAIISSQSYTAYYGNMNLWIGNTNNTSKELRFYGPNNNADYSGAHYTAFKAASQSANLTYILPSIAPATGGWNFMTSTSSGSMSWAIGMTWDSTNSRLGVGSTSPNTSVDVNGDFALRASSIGALANGNVTVNPGNKSFIRVTANAGGTTIAGLSGGSDGKILVIYNTANNLSIGNLNAAAGGSDQIRTMSGGNIVTTGEGTITLIYDQSLGNWLVTSFQP